MTARPPIADRWAAARRAVLCCALMLAPAALRADPLGPRAGPIELTIQGSQPAQDVANALVRTRFNPQLHAARLAADVADRPGSFGLGVPPGVTFRVKGRAVAVEGGAVTVMFAPSANRPQRVLTLHAGDKADWVALSRAALARAQDEYPPRVMPEPVVPAGTLVIVGGGACPEPIVEAFLDAGGGRDRVRLVVVPTAAGAPRDESDAAVPGFLKSARLAHPIQVIDPKTPGQADEPRVLDALRQATALWFGGGRQWRLVDSFEHTRALDEMRNLLRRGGVIGGSSAGATIQGDYLVRGDPLGPAAMIAEGYEKGLAFLPGVGIDQHFAQRDRFADMRLLKRAFPQLLGIGIDEATALVVRGSTARVLGQGGVHLYDRADDSHRTLTAGMRYDIAKRQVLP
jgi:cyanophycinase